MSKHPSLDIVESHGTELSGKKIVLCVAGSVAAYKSIELARLLMRHGANVKCVICLLYTSPSPRDRSLSRMPSSA